MVVSAGNCNIDTDHDGNGYKAYCSAPNVVLVSATSPTASAGINGPWTDLDARASYSNYGVSSDSVAAPGGTSAAAVWAACSRFSLQIPQCQTGTFIVGLRGTSMAAPHTSAVAALISEDVGGNPARIRARLQQSADDLGPSGADPVYGKGRINARRACIDHVSHSQKRVRYRPPSRCSSSDALAWPSRPPSRRGTRRGSVVTKVTASQTPSRAARTARAAPTPRGTRY
ncbi:MAG: S8 family serine peptidase [Gemmatimonadaceae bacterium]